MASVKQTAIVVSHRIRLFGARGGFVKTLRTRDGRTRTHTDAYAATTPYYER
jgi:hypothetical protein